MKEDGCYPQTEKRGHGVSSGGDMRKILILVGVVGLSACAATNPNKTADSIDGKISEAVRISDGMSRGVAATSVAATGGNYDASGSASAAGYPAAADVVLPPDAVQPITVTWNGELESFLANVANRAGYVFKVSGTRPSTPMMISIVSDEEPMFGVVRRAGNMARGYADVLFNPSTKVIEIKYRG